MQEQSSKLPQDRQLALHEINSILVELKRKEQESYVITRAAWYRDRIIGWIIFAILGSGLAYLFFVQYEAAQDLRQTLYQTCIENNERSAAQKNLYLKLATYASEPSPVRDELIRAAELIENRDCRSAYLDRSTNSG